MHYSTIRTWSKEFHCDVRTGPRSFDKLQRHNLIEHLEQLQDELSGQALFPFQNSLWSRVISEKKRRLRSLSSP